MSKYVTERAGGSWYESGRSEDGKLIDVANSNGDVFSGVPTEIGKMLISARDEFLGRIETILDGVEWQ